MLQTNADAIRGYDKCNVCPHICECCANHGGSHACGDCYTKTHHEFKPKAHIRFCPIDGKKIIRKDEKNKPLTIEELIGMQDKAVWVQPKGKPLWGYWGVVEGAIELDGKKYLYLWEKPLPYIIDDRYEVFTTRQMKGE